jgi:hypothetical protein
MCRGWVRRERERERERLYSSLHADVSLSKTEQMSSLPRHNGFSIFVPTIHIGSLPWSQSRFRGNGRNYMCKNENENRNENENEKCVV